MEEYGGHGGVRFGGFIWLDSVVWGRSKYMDPADLLELESLLALIVAASELGHGGLLPRRLRFLSMLGILLLLEELDPLTWTSVIPLRGFSTLMNSAVPMRGLASHSASEGSFSNSSSSSSSTLSWDSASDDSKFATGFRGISVHSAALNGDTFCSSLDRRWGFLAGIEAGASSSTKGFLVQMNSGLLVNEKGSFETSTK